MTGDHSKCHTIFLNLEVKQMNEFCTDQKINCCPLQEEDQRKGRKKGRDVETSCINGHPASSSFSSSFSSSRSFVCCLCYLLPVLSPSSSFPFLSQVLGFPGVARGNTSLLLFLSQDVRRKTTGIRCFIHLQRLTRLVLGFVCVLFIFAC